ncbi:hypothetical protein JB92DRAFT_3130174 [Gautieria morchelliformis]|nr:hypothetical protein JB92DRAFT_3130174 [Gautieria morchelliformis]
MISLAKANVPTTFTLTASWISSGVVPKKPSCALPTYGALEPYALSTYGAREPPYPRTVHGNRTHERNPFIPPSLSPASAKNAGFHGPVLHSSRFSAEVDGIMREIQESPPSEKDTVSIGVIGGGKSAQESVVQMPA